MMNRTVHWWSSYLFLACLIPCPLLHSWLIFTLRYINVVGPLIIACQGYLSFNLLPEFRLEFKVEHMLVMYIVIFLPLSVYSWYSWKLGGPLPIIQNVTHWHFFTWVSEWVSRGNQPFRFSVELISLHLRTRPALGVFALHMITSVSWQFWKSSIKS